ncbi:hypothetical protein FRB90_003751 [Tulasnella sp. 427]|nr:hypothetical protein FRB90_003751 [Tulasnella sp. 427]
MYAFTRRIGILTVLAIGGTQAFDPGHIPPNSGLTGHAFRHGDLEYSLKPWIATRQNSTTGWQFKDGDVDHIYFGNWLRDYSQVIDTGSLKVFDASTLVTIVKVLGYLQFGSASGPFEVTSDRLGVYLPVEHMDNPHNYAGGQDARKYDPRLRPPVQPMELLIDPKSGLKNYIANDSGGWDTSKAYIRRQLQAVATQGRAAMASKSDDTRSQAYSLLGSALHPLEDLLAHSNFLELTLSCLGHTSVFPFVGNSTQIMSPLGKTVYPMVTGTFGASDMVVSYLGGIADYLSQQSVPSLNRRVQMTRAQPDLQQKYGIANIRELDTVEHLMAQLTTLAKQNAVTMRGDDSPTIGMSKLYRRELRQTMKRYDAVRMAVQRDLGVVTSVLSAAGLGKNGNGHVDEKTLSNALLKVITLKDQVKGKVVNGFGDVLGKFISIKGVLGDLEDNLDAFVSRNLQKLITPLVSLIRKKVEQLMNTVIVGTDSQWEVFNATTSTNPTHSLLSKDHFQSILNEPAGILARMVTLNTVETMVRVWENPSLDVDAAISEIVQCIFHPDFSQPQGPDDIQTKMISGVEAWLNTMSPQDQTETLRRLTKDSISKMENVRF